MRENNKLYFYNETGEVIETVETYKEVDTSKVVQAKELPKYEPRNGFYGKLFVENGELVWHFIAVDPNGQLTGEQIAQMFGEVL